MAHPSKIGLEIVDELIYASYRAQRIGNPRISAQEWSALYPDWLALEARWQEESHASID